MNKIILTALAVCFSVSSFAQNAENDKLVEITKAYRNFLFHNEPPIGLVNDLQKSTPAQIKPTLDFIIQTITTNNNILHPQYLTLPDKKTLTYINIITAIYQHVSDGYDINTNTFIDSLKKADTPKNELVDNYYSMLFTALGNKNKPFDLSTYDFKLKDYKLNDTEKGIFFLQCMRFCGMQIWGYMNIVKPANTKKAYGYIKRFPKFDDLIYYQFSDLDFPDFKIIIGKEDDAPQSYKNYYIDKYYDLLLSHLNCLNKEGATEKEINDLLLGSILKDTRFYKYTKNKATLEELFKVVK